MPQRPGKACRVTQCPNISHSNKYQGYCEEHKDKASWGANQQRYGNRHQRGYGNAWDKLRKKILQRDNLLCVMCKSKGKYTKATCVDHIKPKSQGGTDSPSNLQSLCNDCHNTKTAKE